MLKRSTRGHVRSRHLDRYYTDCVIGGTGAFMIPIREPSEFKTATRRKLLLEISGLETPARVIRAQVDGDAWIARSASGSGAATSTARSELSLSGSGALQ